MSYKVVLPSIWKPWTTECLATCKIPLENIHLIDNTFSNIGVPRSWNQGAKIVLDEGLDWLVIMSAAMRFGPPGGMDFIEQVEKFTDQPDIAPFVETADDIGWHLIAVHRWTLENVGLFDENFFPAYFEDNDYAYRSYLIRGKTWGWPRVFINGKIKGLAHGIHQAGLPGMDVGQLDYYIRKWGARPSQELWETPYNEGGSPKEWIKGR